MVDESGSMDGNLSILASKLVIMFYEAMLNYPKIKLFVYGHGDVVYKYIDPKNCKNKFVLGARNSQCGQNENSSYKMIIDDVKSMTKLPIVAFNITDSCYIADLKELSILTNNLRNDKTQKAFINLIALGHNYGVTSSISEWNDRIYGTNNWVSLDGTNYNNKSINDILKKMAEIMKRTIKI